MKAKDIKRNYIDLKMCDCCGEYVETSKIQHSETWGNICAMCDEPQQTVINPSCIEYNQNEY